MRREDFERLYDEHAQPLFGFLLYRTGDRALSEDKAFLSAADDIPEGTARQKSTKKARGGRSDGSAVAPSGVPKGDHVADPERAPGNGTRPKSGT